MSYTNASDDLHPIASDSPSRLEDVVVAIWCILAFSLSAFGSGITLWATIKHRAIKLNKISVHLMKNIAVADMGFAIFAILPITLAVFSQKWVFGTTHCILTEFLFQLFAFVDSNMICALSVSKLLLILYPLKAGIWSSSWYITVILWLLGSIPSLEHLVFWCTGHQEYSSYQHGGVYHCTEVPDTASNLINWMDRVGIKCLGVTCQWFCLIIFLIWR